MTTRYFQPPTHVWESETKTYETYEDDLNVVYGYIWRDMHLELKENDPGEVIHKKNSGGYEGKETLLSGDGKPLTPERVQHNERIATQ